MSLISCIKRNKMTVFRRLYLKRRQQSGEYETSWQLIPNQYIKSWGTVEYSIEDIKPNFYKYSGMQISVVNNDGYFSGETQRDSFFYGTLGIHRTQVRVDAGYVDSDGTEYPTNSTIFIGLISGEDTDYKYDNEVIFKVSHLTQIFEDTPADRITGLTSTLTASQIFTTIKNFTDAGGTAQFQKFITAGAWNITATTYTYDMATTTSLQNMSTWKLMQKLAESENHMVYVDNSANLFFKERAGITTATMFHFSGIGDNNRTSGHNVLKQIGIDSGINKVYNRVKIKLDEDDTLTSYYILNENWQWGDSSSSYRFGIKEYSYENTWLVTATAATIAQNIYSEFSEPKQIIEFDSKFVPQLQLMDRVDMTYRSRKFFDYDLWGYFIYGVGRWGKSYAYNIYINAEEYYIVNMKHNLDMFKTTLKIKEI